MKIYTQLMVVLLMFAQVISARLQVLDNKPHNVELLNTLVMRFCYISFVNIDGQTYIVKQKKSDCFRKIVGAVRDAVMAHFAEGFIPAHLVDVIPAGTEFQGKHRADLPATIHTIAPGKMIKAQNSPYDGMNIKQADIGFRYDMLRWMMKHPVLIKIVAFDTVFCNHDRHRGNLFYNKKTGLFCAIDMDSAFKYNLGMLACQNCTAMLNDKKLRLSNKEVNVLIEYKKHLEFLINNHQPEEIVGMYNYFVEKAGFVEGSAIYTENFALEMEHNRQVIIQGYQDAKELVKIVGKLIEKHKKRLSKRNYPIKSQ